MSRLPGADRRPADRRPMRTCVGCRRVRPQGELVRLVRTPRGIVEPDPRRQRGGRGAYVCPGEACVGEAARRGRWARAFRAPAVLTPEVRGARSSEFVKGGW